MVGALERLQKILKLEQQQGYRNKAVIGGLERLSSRWQADAMQEAGTTAQRALVEEIVLALSRYSSLESHLARKSQVDAILALADSWETADQGDEAERSEDPAEALRSAQDTGAAPAGPAQPDTSASAPHESDDGEAQAERQGPVPGPRPTPVGTASLHASVSRLPGVGPSYTKRLLNLGVRSIGDLLWLLPRRYDDYRNLKPISRLRAGEDVTIIANLWSLKSRPLPGRNATLVIGVLGDSTATIEVTWFNPYVMTQLRTRQSYVFSGRVESYLGQLVLRNPTWEQLDRELVHTGRLVPIYPLTKGISARWMRNLQRQVIDAWGKRIHDPLPEEVRQRARLVALSDALERVHFPENEEDLQVARRRLVFDELFFIQLGVLQQRTNWRSLPAQSFPMPDEAAEAFHAVLPFKFTGAQTRAAQAILADIAGDVPMSRLVQGDVGSGKTVVAAKGMWATVTGGAQAAMMAPTEILAEQHFRGLSHIFAGLRWQGRPVRVALLTGSQSSGERDQTLQALAEGEIDIAVGTHALIQEGVRFHNLGLAVIDEQHRFGVRQRATLRQKGANDDGTAPVPHLLVMSATPIPRTLSLTVFGDLDASVIDEMPPNRQPVKTRWLVPRERERAYSFVRRQVETGHQAFIIYPLVEESERLTARAAVPEYEQLCKEVFPDLRLGLLHGRLKGDEKDAVMQAMQRGEIDILVATSVVEVGIDIPNATVIIIEDAERFGLAQLHQFRGRVGRGEHASYCILISSATSPNAVERLQALEQTQDGFALAEKDLQLRGPGDFFGVRQSGLPDLRLAKLSDLRTLELAREEAVRVLEADPSLSQPRHSALARRVKQFWQGEGDIS